MDTLVEMTRDVAFPITHLLQNIMPVFSRTGIHILVGKISDWSGPVPEKEHCIIAGSGKKREREFTAGRRIMRHLYKKLGVTPLIIGQLPNGAPELPHGYRGSITHTATLCAAVVGCTNDISGIGIDLEHTNRIDTYLWPSVFIQKEIALLSTTTPSFVSVLSTIIYSLKESYIKYHLCEYSTPCDFLDISVTLQPSDGSGCYKADIQLTHPIASFSNMQALAVHYNGIVFSCVITE